MKLVGLLLGSLLGVSSALANPWYEFCVGSSNQGVKCSEAVLSSVTQDPAVTCAAWAKTEGVANWTVSRFLAYDGYERALHFEQQQAKCDSVSNQSKFQCELAISCPSGTMTKPLQDKSPFGGKAIAVFASNETGAFEKCIDNSESRSGNGGVSENDILSTIRTAGPQCSVQPKAVLVK